MIFLRAEIANNDLNRAFLGRPYEKAREKEKPENLMIYWLFLAERVGFEPTVGCPTPDFETFK